MQTQIVVLDRARAQELYQEYKKHLHWSSPVDAECRRAYELLGKGRVIVKALESVAKAGVNAEGWPKLAIAPADAKAVWCRIDHSGGARMSTVESDLNWKPQNRSPDRCFEWPAGTFPPRPRGEGRWGAEAVLPLIPVHMRPKRALAAYHVLWDAEWKKAVPIDPYLLRRIGRSDLWLVVAMWELTEVERAVMQSRVMNA